VTYEVPQFAVCCSLSETYSKLHCSGRIKKKLHLVHPCHKINIVTFYSAK